jgi:hypothetical protein
VDGAGGVAAEESTGDKELPFPRRFDAAAVL